MKIGILVKQVADVASVRIDGKTGEPRMSDKPVMNTNDAHALSEAIDLKEATGGEVIAVSMGPSTVRETLLQALATGADSAVHAPFDGLDGVDALTIARGLAEAIRDEHFDVIVAGEAADDYGPAQVAIQVAELLGVRHMAHVQSVSVEDGDLQVTREVDGFPETSPAQTPIMLVWSPGVDGPKRHASLRGMMQAKRKPIREVAISVEPGTHLSWTPPMAQRVSADRILLEGVAADEAAAQLATWLRENRLVG
jgi:electron transfer flavoprotein beta subunit